MSSNMYLYEKAREAHSQDLRREAEKGTSNRIGKQIVAADGLNESDNVQMRI